MSNFKVGDKVKFLGFKDSIAESDGTNEYIGSIGTITHVTKTWGIFVDYGADLNNELNGTDTFTNVLNLEEELELVNEQ